MCIRDRIWYCGTTLCLVAAAALPNRTLSLKDSGDYVRLPSDILGPLEETTVECWVKWDQFLYYSQPFGFSEPDRRNVFALNNHSTSNNFQFFAYHNDVINVLRLKEFLVINQWYHFAVSAGSDGARLVCNGIELQRSNFSEVVTAIQNDTENFLGRSQWTGNADFNGELDEVRVWDRVLSVEEIRKDLFRRLSGTEPGLVAYWNFDSGQADDSGPAAKHGVLEGNASCVESAVPQSFAELTQPSLMTGTVTDSFGNPLSGAILRVYCGSQILIETTTDTKGSYTLQLINECDSLDLWCTWKTLGAWKSDFKILPDVNPSISFTLTNQSQIKGSISALDNSPQSGVAVQALRQAMTGGAFEIAQKTQSDSDGNFAFSNLRPGNYIIGSQAGREFVYYRSDTPSTVEIPIGAEERHTASVLRVEADGLIEAVQLRFPIPRSGRWHNFTYLDGLGSSSIHSLFESTDGMIWIGTGAGIVCYDGKSFREVDGPAAPHQTEIRAIIEAPRGTLWFATDQGLYRYTDKSFHHYTTEHGLPSIDVLSMATSMSQVLYCGTALGICLFDGDRFYPPGESHQVQSPISNIEFLPNGSRLLLAPLGVVIENGKTLDWYQGPETPFRHGILEGLFDSNHRAWFSTPVGVSQYQFEENLFHWKFNLSSRDGLPEEAVTAMLEDTDESIWFGTENGDIYRQSQDGVTAISKPDELGSNQISVMLVQSNQNLWVGTIGGGLSLLELSLIHI